MFLEQQGMGQAFFDSAEEEGADLAADVRKRTLQLGPPPIQSMFDNVYSCLLYTSDAADEL